MEQFSGNMDILASFQAVFGNEAALFQVAELFPIPIQIFTPDGMTVFANRALLEMWNISDTSQIVGRYNLIQDPVVNEELKLREYVQRVFKGEVVRVRDARLPLKAFSEWYRPRRPDYAVKSMYLDILNFPIFDENRSMTHVVSCLSPPGSIRTGRTWRRPRNTSKRTGWRRSIWTKWRSPFTSAATTSRACSRSRPA